MTETQTTQLTTATRRPKSPFHKRKRMRPIELWQLREQRKKDGICVDCGGEVAKKLNGQPSLRCKMHLKGNSGKTRTRETPRIAQDAEDNAGGHLDKISFVEYQQRIVAAIHEAGATGASLRYIHESLAGHARRDWTLDALRVLKTAGLVREGTSVLVTRWFAVDGTEPLQINSPDPEDSLDSKDEYDELLAFINPRAAQFAGAAA